MAGLAGFREQYPQYADVPDAELADSLHAKFYSDIPKDQYLESLGMGKPSLMSRAGAALKPAEREPMPSTADTINAGWTNPPEERLSVPGSVMDGYTPSENGQGLPVEAGMGPMRKDYYDQTRAGLLSAPVEKHAAAAKAGGQVGKIAAESLPARVVANERAAAGDTQARTMQELGDQTNASLTAQPLRTEATKEANRQWLTENSAGAIEGIKRFTKLDQADAEAELQQMIRYGVKPSWVDSSTPDATLMQAASANIGATGPALQKALLGLSEAAADQPMLQLPWMDYAKRTPRQLEMTVTNLDKQIRAARNVGGKIEAGSWNDVVSTIGPSLATNMPPLIAAALVAAKNPAAGMAIANGGLGVMGMQKFGDNYLKGQMKGLSAADNLTQASLGAAAEVIPEKLSLNSLFAAFKTLGKGSAIDAVKAFAKQQLTEHSTEQITTIADHLIDKAYTEPNKSIESLWSEMKQTAMATAVQAPLLAAGGAAAHITGQAVVGAKQRFDEGRDITAGMQFDLGQIDAAARQALDPANAQMRQVGTRAAPVPPQASTRAELAAVLSGNQPVAEILAAQAPAAAPPQATPQAPLQPAAFGWPDIKTPAVATLPDGQIITGQIAGIQDSDGQPMARFVGADGQVWMIQPGEADIKPAPAAAKRQRKSAFVSSTQFSVDTEDNGKFDVTVHRTATGDVVINHPDGLIEHKAEFANGKADTDLLAYDFEPVGFRNAAQAPAGDGTRTAPVQAETAEHVKIAEQAVNTEPTEGQKQAGNYQLGHLVIQGLDIAIENPAGSVRSGVGKDGKPWSNTLNHTYGFLKGATAADGDKLDVFIGPDPQSQQVFVIDQIDPDTGRYDEAKTMLGFNSLDEARAAYLSNYDAGWKGVGAITPLSMPAFKAWIAKGETHKPLAYDQKAAIAERKAAADTQKAGEAYAAEREKAVAAIGEDQVAAIEDQVADQNAGQPTIELYRAIATALKAEAARQATKPARQPAQTPVPPAQPEPVAAAAPQAAPQPAAVAPTVEWAVNKKAKSETLAYINGELMGGVFHTRSPGTSDWGWKGMESRELHFTQEKAMSVERDAVLKRYERALRNRALDAATPTDTPTSTPPATPKQLEMKARAAKNIDAYLNQNAAGRWQLSQPIDDADLRNRVIDEMDRRNQGEVNAAQTAQSPLPAVPQEARKGAALPEQVAKQSKPNDTRFVIKRDDVTGDKVEWQGKSSTGEWQRLTTFDTIDAARAASSSQGYGEIPVLESTWNAKAKRFSVPAAVAPTPEVGALPGELTQPPSTGESPVAQSGGTTEERAYTKGQAEVLARRMTNQGLPSEAYPHPTEAGMWAIRVPGEQEAAPVEVAPPKPEAPAITKIKDAYGRTHHVRQSDLDNEARTQLPLYSAAGKRIDGTIHRENIDPTGEKLAQRNAENADNSLLDVITADNDRTFKTEAAAKRRLGEGYADTHVVAPASQVQPGATGFVLVRKPVAEQPADVRNSRIANDQSPDVDFEAMFDEVLAEETPTAPTTVSLPQAVSAAISGQMGKQKRRMMRLNTEAKADGLNLQGKLEAQTKAKAAEASLTAMRTNVFAAEDAATKAIAEKDLSAFAEFEMLFPDAHAEIAKQLGVSAAPPTPKQKEMKARAKKPVTPQVSAPAWAPPTLAEALNELAEMKSRASGPVVDARLLDRIKQQEALVKELEAEADPKVGAGETATKERFEYPNPKYTSPSDLPAMRAVVDYMNGDITRDAMTQIIVDSGLPEGTIRSITNRLGEDSYSNGEIADIKRRQAAAKEASPAPTIAKSTKSAVVNTAKGLDDAINGLGKLFGGTPGTLGMGPVFNEDTYAQAKPLFASAVAHFKDAGQDLKEVMRAVIRMVQERFGAGVTANMRPYIIRFMEDVKAGNVVYDGSKENVGNATSSTDTETAGSLPGIPEEGLSPDEGGRKPGKVPRNKGAVSDRPNGNADGTGDLFGPGTGDSAGGPIPAGTNAKPGTDGIRGDVSPAQGVKPDSLQPERRVGDYVITDATRLGEGGAKTKFRNNVAAIRLIAELDETARPVTSEDQDVLARYVGWGMLPQAFDPANQDWAKEHAELKGLLNQEEWDAAFMSTRYAHYTSEEIITNGVYAALERFGFSGGRILEPGSGVGNFVGLMPASMRTAGSRVTGIEREWISAKIGQYLYPTHNMLHADFTEFQALDGYFDAAIGNPPFAATALTDASGRKHLSGLSIHNYFFAKSIDMLRENGVFAMVVSNSFLDAARDNARRYIGERTRFLGAIRLPNNAFKKNAGTEVTTDIIFLQKLPDADVNSKATKEAAKAWMDLETIPDPLGGEVIPINAYFKAHPEMMLGRMERSGTMYTGGMSALVAKEGANITEQLREAIARLPQNVYVAPALAATKKAQDRLRVALEDDTVQPGGYYTKDGRLYIRLRDEAGEKLAEEITPKSAWTEKTLVGDGRFARLVAIADLRRTVRQLLAAEIRDDAAEMKRLRKQLNTQYDAIVKEWDFLNAKGTIQLIGDDPDYPLLAALETDYNKGIDAKTAKAHGVEAEKPSAKKMPIFTQRVIPVHVEVTKADTPVDALMISIYERGHIDQSYISALLGGRDAQAIIDELVEQEHLFLDPELNHHVLKDEYLSGNVRRKLKIAQAAGMNKNARALEHVIPEDVPSHNIIGKMGANWISNETYQEFINEQLGDGTTSRIKYQATAGSFIVEIKAGSDVANTNTLGIKTEGGRATDLIEKILNKKQIKLGHYDDKGKFHLDKEATDNATDKATEIKTRFADWLFRDAERSAFLTRAYNDAVNNYVVRKYDGALLSFPGKVPDSIIKFRRHQRNAIARILQSGQALLDHVVGAGKTFTIVAAAMEMRRTGLAHKPMVVVPNHLVKQWASDFYRLYPGAKVLAATKNDFQRENRRAFMAKIATGDWDAVIIAHSSFGFIRPDPAFEAEFNGVQIQEITDAINELGGEVGKKDSRDKGTKRTVKQLAAMREKLQERIKALRQKPMDNLLDLAELGVDALFVDEAHAFKNLMFTTKMQGVRVGGDPSGSQRAYDMYLKTHQIMKKNGGRGVVFATGTPISNTMAEMYHVLRYLAPETLTDMGLKTFDAWADSFASAETFWMQSMSGEGYKSSTRLEKFVNVPSLLKVYDQVADTVTMDDIKDAYREENDGKEFPIPAIKGGKSRTPVSIKRSDAQTAYMADVAKRAKALEQRKGPPKKGEDNMLSIMGDARKAAMDIRLVDHSTIERDPEGRIAIAAGNIWERYQQFDAVKGTQLVFSDMGTPKKTATKELKEYQELKDRADKLDDQALQDRATLGDAEAQAALDDAEDAVAAIDAKGKDWLDAIKAAMRGFSIYDDLKQALIEKGIPDYEIAFIHDYNTDDQKAALFKAVNSGKIRVVMGSTPKMGAGTNVQERLVALHHLDIPWRPSDVEQREGRIVRQGNKLLPVPGEPRTIDHIDGFEVEILAYATQDTLDLYMWQTQENKLKMIGQLRTGNVDIEMDNAFEEMEFSAGEMQAAATSNPYLLDEIRLKDRIKKLERQKRSHEGQANDIINRGKQARKEVGFLPAEIKRNETLASGNDKYLALIRETDAAMSATVQGKEVAGREAIMTTLNETLDAMRTSVEVEINGTTLKASSKSQFLDMLGEIQNKTEEDIKTVTIAGEKAKVGAFGAEAAKAFEDALDKTAHEKIKAVGFEFAGKTYKSYSALAEAVRAFTGDRDRIIFTIAGKDYTQRSKIDAAVRPALERAIDGESRELIGEFAGTKVYVEAVPDRKDAEKVILNVQVEHDGASANKDVTPSGTWESQVEPDQAKNMGPQIVAMARRLMDNARSDADYSTSRMEKAKRTLADVESRGASAEWDGEADLKEARKKYEEILKKLAGKDKELKAAAVIKHERMPPRGMFESLEDDQRSAVTRAIDRAIAQESEPKTGTKRGAGWLKIKLRQAQHKGELSAKAVEMVEWLVKQNPALVKYLAVAVENPSGLAGFNSLAYNQDHGLSNLNLDGTLDAATLRDLRREAAGLERPKSGTFLTVTDDGRAVATGQPGTRVPETFTRFAEKHGLTFDARRIGPKPSVGGVGKPVGDMSISNRTGSITPMSEPMPIEYRESGAMYFGESGAFIDRTGKTRFDLTTGQASGNYNPFTQVMTLFRGNVSDTTAVHEILHHLERMMPAEMQAEIRKEWLRAVTSELQKATKAKDQKRIDYFTAVLAGDQKKATELLTGKRMEGFNAPALTSTVKIGRAFSSLVTTLGKDDVSELLMNWNDSELSDDGTKIILFPGRDRRYSAGELGGSLKVGKGEFLSWLHSDAPLDPSVFEVSDEWRTKVEAARNATGLNPAQPEFNAVEPAPTFKAVDTGLDDATPDEQFDAVARLAESRGWNILSRDSSNVSNARYMRIEKPTEYDPEYGVTEYEVALLRFSGHANRRVTADVLDAELDLNVAPGADIFSDAMQQLDAFMEAAINVPGRNPNDLAIGQDYQYLNPSEFWAVRMTNAMAARFEAKSIWARSLQWLREALEHIKGALGLKSDHPLLKALDDLIARGTGEFVSKEMLGSSEVYASIEESGPEEVAGVVMRDVSLAARLLLHPRQVAANHKPFVPVFDTAIKQFEERDRIVSGLGEMAKPYFELTHAQRLNVNKIVEQGRLDRTVYTVADLENGIHHAESGDLVTLDAEEIGAYKALRKTFNEALSLFRDTMLEEFGFAELIPEQKAAMKLRQMIADGEIEESRIEWARHVAKAIDEIEQAKRTGYAPFNRYGQFVVAVKALPAGVEVQDDDGKQLVTGIPEDGDDPLTQIVTDLGGQYDVFRDGWVIDDTRKAVLRALETTLFATKVEVNAFNEWRKQGKDVTAIPEVKAAFDEAKRKYGKAPNARVLAFHITEKAKADDANLSTFDELARISDVDVETWDAVREKLQEAIKAKSFRKHFFGSDNTPGYSVDFERSVADYIIGMSGYLARRKHVKDFDNAIKRIKAPALAKYAEDYRKYVNAPADEFALLKNIGFLYYIAGSTATAVANLTQVPMLTMPTLVQFVPHHIAAREVARAWGETLAMFSPTKTGLQMFAPAKVPADVRDVFKAAWEDQLFVPLETLDLMAASSIKTVGGRKTMRALSVTTQAIAYMFMFAERLNRITTFIAAARISRMKVAKDRMRDVVKNDAWARHSIGGRAWGERNFAEWAVDESQYRMGKVNRPTVMRGVGSPLLQFKGYMIQTLEAGYRMAVMHGKGGKPAALAALAMMLMLGGLWGLPGLEDLRDMIERLYKLNTGKDLDLKTEVRQLIARETGSATLAAAANKGIPYATVGVDMSRVGLGNIVPDSALQVGGIPADLAIGRPWRASEKMMAGKPVEAMSEFLPNFLKNPATGLQWKFDGLRDKLGTRMMTPGQFDYGDVAIKSLGWTPTKVTNRREYTYAESRAERGIDELKRRYTNDLVRAYVHEAEAKDPAEKAEYRADQAKILARIEEHNKTASPENLIKLDPGTLRRKAAAEFSGSAAREGKERKLSRGEAVKRRELFQLR